MGYGRVVEMSGEGTGIFFSVWEMGDQVQRRKLSRSLQQTLYPFDEDTGISY
jgi:hypothetical protein